MSILDNLFSNKSEKFWKYGVIGLVVSIMVHVAFLLFFYLHDIAIMVIFNIFGIAIFSYSLFLLKQKRYSLILLITHLEVILYSLIATYMIGLESGFYYYLFILVILSFVVKDKYAKVKVAKVIILIGMFFLNELLFSNVTPVYIINYESIQYLRIFNLLGFLALSIPITYYYTKVSIETDKILYSHATKDQLTGLYNRRHFVSVANYEFSKRTDEPLSMVITDIDFFKKVNDTYGHGCGDAVLIAIANKLNSTLRKGDTLSRWGGEEFLYLLPNTTKDQACILAQRLKNDVSELKVDCPNDICVSVTQTFGIAQREDGESFDDTLARADIALYDGKHAGRNCVICAIKTGK